MTCCLIVIHFFVTCSMSFLFIHLSNFFSCWIFEFLIHVVVTLLHFKTNLSLIHCCEKTDREYRYTAKPCTARIIKCLLNSTSLFIYKCRYWQIYNKYTVNPPKNSLLIHNMFDKFQRTFHIQMMSDIRYDIDTGFDSGPDMQLLQWLTCNRFVRAHPIVGPVQHLDTM